MSRAEKKPKPRAPTKVIRDGKVAVLYSPDHGAGWSTWAHGEAGIEEFMMYDAALVALAEAGARENDPRWAEVFKAAGYGVPYLGGIDDGLQIEWVPEGTQFEIHEYDGSETVQELGPKRGYFA